MVETVFAIPWTEYVREKKKRGQEREGMRWSSVKLKTGFSVEYSRLIVCVFLYESEGFSKSTGLQFLTNKSSF